MANNEKKPRFELLTVITTAKLAEKAADMFKGESFPLQYRFNAQGTASSEIMDMLGLGSTDKSVIVSAVPEECSKMLLQKLHTELKLDTVNSGIAFTMPINGANNLIVKMLTQIKEKNSYSQEGRNEASMTESNYALVVAIVNRGFSGDVMEAAKAAGARGGTLIHSRYIGSEETVAGWGLDVQEEKEIIMIISDSENKVPIMQSISEKCGLHSKAEGMVVSLPINSVMGI